MSNLHALVHSTQPKTIAPELVRLPPGDTKRAGLPRRSNCAPPMIPQNRYGGKANRWTATRRINEDVIIRLKWGQTEYKGRLISVDSYMNVQLSNTEEYIDRKHTGTLGQVLIRYGSKLQRSRPHDLRNTLLILVNPPQM